MREYECAIKALRRNKCNDLEVKQNEWGDGFVR